MRDKILKFIYHMLYGALKDYFLRKHKSELLEGACQQARGQALVVSRVVEVEKHRLVLPLQHSFRTNSPVIADYGCYFLCILFLALVVKEIKDGVEKCFDKFEVDLLYKSLASLGSLRAQNSYVESPNLILACLGLDEHVCYKDKHHDVSYVAGDEDMLVGQYKDNESGLHHFVVLGSGREVVWDSLGNSQAVRSGSLLSLRVFKLLDKKLTGPVKDRLSFYKQQFENLKESLEGI
ncbi:DUF261 family protein [Borrelia sp. RT5S]|uniref:DUF261 family protein n=1 Tax=Borrelia sp. RT5S TaxID=2898581 RepID=UPI001E649775|nr:DUF261 family protein [Borrelia sp. RT5S]UGQ16706.1 DUF261 domain-containing protein [Borrelia sp. RT5S]